MPNPEIGEGKQLMNRNLNPSSSGQKKPYKIVLETVTQEKKKLRSSTTYNPVAPPGYTFVPVGVPELTEFCKELSRERGLDVYVVSTTPRNRGATKSEAISKQIHRIGHHFANWIVERGCQWRGYRRSTNGLIEKNPGGLVESNAIAKTLDSHGRRLGVSDQNSSEEQRTEQVRRTIRELFPRIPSEDVENIVRRAFEKGTGRVGSANHLPLARRVQLAVVAHIRHNYTDYDTLLRIVSWHEARAMAEQPCLDQIVKWRGEDDGSSRELEEIFREVIVIDDDEEAQALEDSSDADRDNRELSVEIIASRTKPADLDYDTNCATHHSNTADQSVPEIIHVQPTRYHRPPSVLQSQEYSRRYNMAKARSEHPGEQRTMNTEAQEHAPGEHRSAFTLPFRGQVNLEPYGLLHNPRRENHLGFANGQAPRYELRSLDNQSGFEPAHVPSRRLDHPHHSSGRLHVPFAEHKDLENRNHNGQGLSERREISVQVQPNIRESIETRNYAAELNQKLRGLKRKSVPEVDSEDIVLQDLTISSPKRQKTRAQEEAYARARNAKLGRPSASSMSLRNRHPPRTGNTTARAELVDLTSPVLPSARLPPSPSHLAQGSVDYRVQARQEISSKERDLGYGGQAGLWPHGRRLDDSVAHTPSSEQLRAFSDANRLWDLRRYDPLPQYLQTQPHRLMPLDPDPNQRTPAMTYVVRPNFSQPSDRSGHIQRQVLPDGQNPATYPGISSHPSHAYSFWRVDPATKALTRDWTNGRHSM